MPRSERDSRRYEMMIVVAPTVTEEGLPAVVDRVGGYVTSLDGTLDSVTYENPWGRRRLAYKIQDFDHAYYVLYYFTAPPKAVNDLERELRLDEVVIRHLIVRYDPLAERADTSPFDGQPASEDASEAVTEDAAPAEAEAAVAVATEETAATATEAEDQPAAEAETSDESDDEADSAEEESTEDAADDETA